jgi:hypothetical protein
MALFHNHGKVDLPELLTSMLNYDYLCGCNLVMFVKFCVAAIRQPRRCDEFIDFNTKAFVPEENQRIYQAYSLAPDAPACRAGKFRYSGPALEVMA